MKLDATSFANAAAAAAGIIYLACRALVAVAPGFLMRIFNSWVHTVDFGKIRTSGGMTLGSFVLGLVSIVVVAWIVDYLFAVIYNGLINKTE